MLPILALIGMYFGVLGGYAVSVFRAGVPDGSFWMSIRQFVQPSDFTNGMIKSAVFGFIISIVACQQGLRTKDGAVGVGQSTTRTVVICMVLIYVSNFFLTDMMFRR